MAQNIKAQELRELLVLAKKLRVSASGTTNHTYTELFLHAAAALEDRASRLANGIPDTAADTASHVPVDLVC